MSEIVVIVFYTNFKFLILCLKFTILLEIFAKLEVPAFNICRDYFKTHHFKREIYRQISQRPSTSARFHLR